MWRRVAAYWLGVVVIGGLVSCEDVPTSTLPGPYVPPPVKGDDGRRLLWEPGPMEAQCYEPSFSPDGTKVVVSYRFGIFARAADLAILDLTTGKIDVILEGNCAKRPSWSPTGKWIVYGSDSDIAPYNWLCRPNGSENHRIEIKWAKAPRWGSGGDRIYFSTAIEPREPDYAVYYDLEEEKLNVLRKDAFYHHGAVVPAPGEEKITFNLISTSGKPVDDVILALINKDGKGFERLWGPGNGTGGPVIWSPDSKYILVWYGVLRSDQEGLWTYEVKSGVVRQLTRCPRETDFETIEGASWGPNGDIVFASEHGSLYLIKAPE